MHRCGTRQVRRSSYEMTDSVEWSADVETALLPARLCNLFHTDCIVIKRLSVDVICGRPPLHYATLTLTFDLLN